MRIALEDIAEHQLSVALEGVDNLPVDSDLALQAGITTPVNWANYASALPYGLRWLLSHRGRRFGFAWLAAPAKRTSDILLAGGLLLLALPMMAAAAVAVRMMSPGPIFYTQERCGRNGRSFKIIKFRSMVPDAEERIDEMVELAKATELRTSDAPMFKSADDPRITTVGRFLRRTGIDELPQLLNVLRGEMSLVGPRPLVPDEARTLGLVVAGLRHAVRPGLTCLWQVLRTSDTSFDERIQLDLLYTRRRSLVLDLALIAMTPVALVVGDSSH